MLRCCLCLCLRHCGCIHMLRRSCSVSALDKEMIQQAFFHNMPLAFATAQKEPVDHYIPLNRQLQSLLYWWTPDTKFTLDNPSQIIFPPNSPSEYANQIFKTQRENVDLTNWAAAGPQKPAKVLRLKPAFLPSSSCVKELLQAPGCWCGSHCRSGGSGCKEPLHRRRRAFFDSRAAPLRHTS